ncbi:stearoyl-CoA desaturase 5-like isoform X2 [Asterias amurensis]
MKTKGTKMSCSDQNEEVTDIDGGSPLLDVKPQAIIVWRNVVLMATLHGAAIYALLCLTWKCYLYTLLWASLLYWVGALGITAGAHRLWAHRSYKAKLPLRLLLAMFDCIAFQMDIYFWVREHRVHHRFSETNADPHNAKRGFFFSHVGWLLCRKHPDVIEKGSKVDLSDLMADPVIRYQRKYFLPLMLFFCFIMPTTIPTLWGESLWNAYFIAAILRYCLLMNSTWLVNSAAHLWGSKPYDRSINPVENALVSTLTGGEGWHNYHHTFPWDYRAGEFGWRINPTTMFIDLMAVLGQVTDRKTTSRESVKSRKLRTG